uniref:Uncharacterized protein n=1 Tax=Brassica campestris TaxID=3711 RepID=M4F600_BRACM
MGARFRSDVMRKLERLAQSDAPRSLASHTLLGATSQSDTPRSLASLWRDDTKRSLERPLRATYQGRSRSRATRWSDTPKSLATSRPDTPKIGPGATSRSDTCKSLRVILLPKIMIS